MSSAEKSHATAMRDAAGKPNMLPAAVDVLNNLQLGGAQLRAVKLRARQSWPRRED